VLEGEGETRDWLIRNASLPLRYLTYIPRPVNTSLQGTCLLHLSPKRYLSINIQTSDIRSCKKLYHIIYLICYIFSVLFFLSNYQLPISRLPLPPSINDGDPNLDLLIFFHSPFPPAYTDTIHTPRKYTYIQDILGKIRFPAQPFLSFPFLAMVSENCPK
jgi:hypothetical protein